MGESEFERGKKEGHVEAQLAEHSQHLSRINGSIDRFTDVTRDAAAATRELSSEIRTLQEEGRLAAERVRVAAATLATETERRRAELAETVSSGDRRFSKRERLAALLIALVAALAAVYIATH